MNCNASEILRQLTMGEIEFFISYFADKKNHFSLRRLFAFFALLVQNTQDKFRANSLF